jgi:hypothetical protein
LYALCAIAHASETNAQQIVDDSFVPIIVPFLKSDDESDIIWSERLIGILISQLDLDLLVHRLDVHNFIAFYTHLKNNKESFTDRVRKKSKMLSRKLKEYCDKGLSNSFTGI